VRQPDSEINACISFLPRGDSTQLKADAITNAANANLSHGNGLCGAIHDAAGPELEIACRAIGSCPTGTAVLTPGFNLPAKYVIHAVGPMGRKDRELKSAYKATLGFIDGKEIRSIGLCCLSVGIYGFPLRPGTQIALETVREFLEDPENRSKTDRIVFVVYAENEVAVYEDLLPKYFPLAPRTTNNEEEEDVVEPPSDHGLVRIDPVPHPRLPSPPPSPPPLPPPRRQVEPKPKEGFVRRFFKWLWHFVWRK
jgi:O-acetyl-ADP-ribose deacetylase (regulator of RNase III)